MLFVLLSMYIVSPSPSIMGRGVHPAAWGKGAMELTDAPAGLSRMEYPGLSGWVRSPAGSSTEFTLAGGMPVPGGKFSLGGLLSANSGFDQYTGVLGGSWVLTGDPIGFMEGLFGPSIVLGCAAGVTDSGTGADMLASGSAQFSLFPSFALGASSIWREGDSPYVALGFSHVFNRAFTLNAGLSQGDPEVGGVLKISRHLSVSAGTGGDAWHSGLVLEVWAARMDLAVVFKENQASGGAGLTWIVGW
jgi:hypothetical protein